jgi:broad specificity phosphatase PhoE
MRHAARDYDTGQDHLSADGHKQAASLEAELTSRGLLTKELAATARLVSSPKVRTQSTLRFLAESLDTRVEVSPLLDERLSGESRNDFESRVKTCLEKWTETPAPFLLACSHLDWLELASLYLTSDEGDLTRSQSWTPCEVRGYKLTEGLWTRL